MLDSEAVPDFHNESDVAVGGRVYVSVGGEAAGAAGDEGPMVVGGLVDNATSTVDQVAPGSDSGGIPGVDRPLGRLWLLPCSLGHKRRSFFDYRRRSGKLPWTQLSLKRLEALFIGMENWGQMSQRKEYSFFT